VSFLTQTDCSRERNSIFAEENREEMRPRDREILLVDKLLRCFDDPPTVEEIASRIGEVRGRRVSRDVVRRCVERIESTLPTGCHVVKIPIEDPTEQRRKGGRVAIRYNQLPPQRGLSLEENELLENMRMIYQEVANLPWLPEARQLMEYFNLADSESDLCRRQLFLDSDATASLGSRAVRHLGDLFDAALRSYSVSITYRRFEGESRVHDVSVLALKQDDRFWYAAVCNAKSLLRQQTEGQWPFFWLAVDRVERVTLSDAPYQSVDVDWEAYFGQIIGITNPYDKPVEEVRLLAYGNRRDFLLAAPLHTSQKACRRLDLPDEPLEVVLRVKDNHELRNRLNAMLGDVVVTAPQHLADWQREVLQKAVERVDGQKVLVISE